MEEFSSNKSLIKGIKAGESSAFEYLYNSYYNGLCAFSSQYVTTQESEEIVHDTMLWIWENKEALIPDLQIKSLLFTIVKNKSLNLIKHKKIKYSVLEEFKIKYSTTFEDPEFYIYNNLRDVFDAALIKLPEDYREAFIMNRFQNLSYEEIADIKKVSTKTIAYRISNTLKFLRTELKDYLPIMLFLF